MAFFSLCFHYVLLPHPSSPRLRLVGNRGLSPAIQSPVHLGTGMGPIELSRLGLSSSRRSKDSVPSPVRTVDALDITYHGGIPLSALFGLRCTERSNDTLSEQRSAEQLRALEEVDKSTSPPPATLRCWERYTCLPDSQTSMRL